MGHHQSSRAEHLFPANYATDVVVARLDVEADAVDASAALLSDVELKRSSRFAFERDRYRFILTAALLWAIACFLVACGGGGDGSPIIAKPINANVFQTTFDIDEWLQPTTFLAATDAELAPDGDGIEGNLGNTTSNGSLDQITAAANNPAGGGGKGFRHWVGDGNNNAGGGIRVRFSPVSEMWLRYYIRFQRGFAWDGDSINMKTIYCNYDEEGHFYFGLKDNMFAGNVRFDHISGRGGGLQGDVLSTFNWDSWQGGSTGDDQFHVVEVHVKMNNVGGQNGTFEAKLDGVLRISYTDVRFQTGSGAQFNNCKVGENHYNPQNGADRYVDFDDIAISTEGYIGP